MLFFAPAPEGVEVPLPLFEFWRDEVTVATSYAAGPQDIAEAIELLRARRVRVKEMITHRLSLAEAGLGFELVASGQDAIKVIIDPSPHERSRAGLISGRRGPRPFPRVPSRTPSACSTEAFSWTTARTARIIPTG